MPIEAFLGTNKLFFGDLRLGQSIVAIDGTQNPFPVTGGLDMWVDARLWSGVGNLNASVGNYTASLINATKTNINEGVITLQSSSILEISGSGGAAINYTSFASYSVVLIGKNSGSDALQHGRMLNSTTNWFMGTHAETVDDWFAVSNWVYDGSTPDDQLWRVYTGVQHTASSASFYVNNVYKGGTTAAVAGFNGLMINKGQSITQNVTASGEYTYCEIGQILVYNRPLTQTEIGQIYSYFGYTYR